MNGALPLERPNVGFLPFLPPNICVRSSISQTIFRGYSARASKPLNAHVGGGGGGKVRGEKKPQDRKADGMAGIIEEVHSLAFLAKKKRSRERR